MSLTPKQFERAAAFEAHQQRLVQLQRMSYRELQRLLTGDTTIGWVMIAGWAGVRIEDFPHLSTWEQRMVTHKGVQLGQHVPVSNKMKQVMKDKNSIERLAARSREWVQRGMQQDAKIK